MARNYSIYEAVNIIATGTDYEAIADLGRRYPILSVKIATLVSKAPNEVVDFMKYFPDFISANKINKAIKESIDGGEEEETEESVAEVEDEEEVVEEKKPAKKGRGRKKAEVEKEEVEEEAEDAYSNMTAIELLKECKKRKIKAAVPKKPQSFYIDLLKKDDAKKAKEAEKAAEAEDEWDEEETVEEKKPAKKARPKATAKKQPDPEPETEDEDEDWDI